MLVVCQNAAECFLQNIRVPCQHTPNARVLMIEVPNCKLLRKSCFKNSASFLKLSKNAKGEESVKA